MNNHNYVHLRERERESNKTWLWITLGVVLIGGAGTGVYFLTQQNIETQSFEEKFSTLNNHLAELQEFSAILDLGIAQTESSLQTKKQEQISNPSDSNLQTEINQLEQQLTTFKTQKEKLATILPKLEQQTANLTSNEKVEVLQKLEQEIKNINKEEIKDNLKIKTSDLSKSTYKDLEDDTIIIQRYLENCNKRNEANKTNLTKTANGQSKYEVDKVKYQQGLQEIRDIRAKFSGLYPNQHDIIDCRTSFQKKWSNIFDPKAPKKPDQPDNPNPQNNIQLFQKFQGQVQELNTLLEKINQDYQEISDNWNALPQASRDMIEAMFKDYTSIKSWINSLTPLNNGKLNEYGSDSDYQIFLSASPETQKINLELFESNFDLVLKETKISLENVYTYLGKTVKWGEEWIEDMKRNGVDPSIYSSMQLELNKFKTAIISKDAKFGNFNQKTIAERIKAIQEVYQELDRVNWKNVRRT